MEEIEYKYLVDKEKWDALAKPKGELIVQSFIHNSKECVVRIRIKGAKGFLTIKGETKGITRKEFEYEIPTDEANEMIEEAKLPCLHKTRFYIQNGNDTWELDVFHGALEGLLVAELELTEETQFFEKPNWLGEEVTFDPAYLNSNLIDRL